MFRLVESNQDRLVTSDQLKATEASLTARIDTGLAEVRSEIAEVNSKIDTGLAEVHSKIDTGLAEVRSEIAEVNSKIDTGLAMLETRMTRLTLGSTGLLGLLIVALRLFQ